METKYLTKGGRLVLARSTLASLLVMSLFVMLTSIAENYEKTVRSIIWGTSKGKESIILSLGIWFVCL